MIFIFLSIVCCSLSSSTDRIGSLQKIADQGHQESVEVNAASFQSFQTEACKQFSQLSESVGKEIAQVLQYLEHTKYNVMLYSDEAALEAFGKSATKTANSVKEEKTVTEIKIESQIATLIKLIKNTDSASEVEKIVNDIDEELLEIFKDTSNAQVQAALALLKPHINHQTISKSFSTLDQSSILLNGMYLFVAEQQLGWRIEFNNKANAIIESVRELHEVSKNIELFKNFQCLKKTPAQTITQESGDHLASDVAGLIAIARKAASFKDIHDYSHKISDDIDKKVTPALNKLEGASKSAVKTSYKPRDASNAPHFGQRQSEDETALGTLFGSLYEWIKSNALKGHNKDLMNSRKQILKLKKMFDNIEKLEIGDNCEYVYDGCSGPSFEDLLNCKK